MRDLTEFLFFKNTPLIDFSNTIHFESNAERDNFFLNQNRYSTLQTRNLRFNFVRDRSTIDVPISYNEFKGVNYCTFLSQVEPDIRYYAYVISYEYLNDNNTRVYLLIDAIMTFTQGNVLNNLRNLDVDRRHLTREEYHEKLWELKNNDDVLKTNTKSYFRHSEYTFRNFDVIIQCSCDLSADFGSVDDPKIETSRGLTFDKITSPVNLYHVSQSDFTLLMELLAPYPWITQNISKVILIPSNFINEDDLEVVTMAHNNFRRLRIFKDNGSSEHSILENDIKYLNSTMDELYSAFGLKENEKHILRSEYTTSEVYSWDGQQMLIDNGQLNEDTGLEFQALVVTGYHNEVGIYLKNYRVDKPLNRDREGAFLNESIYFRNFDDIPILIDNYNLTLASNANQRAHVESRLVSNRVRNVLNSNANLQDRFMNAASLVSNFSPMNLFGKFSEEHDYYKQQQAEFKDLALRSDTITQQSNDNGLKRAEDFFSITLKHAIPSKSEMDKIKKYYKLFGFELNEKNTSIKINTQNICDYVRFSGSWTIPNVDVSLIEMMKAQFENGVRFWHNNGSSNPMNRNVMNNTWR